VRENEAYIRKTHFLGRELEQIDYDAKTNFVIERVFERGDVEDIRQCRRYYTFPLYRKIVWSCCGKDTHIQ
jgi:hypothetical protein